MQSVGSTPTRSVALAAGVALVVLLAGTAEAARTFSVTGGTVKLQYAGTQIPIFPPFVPAAGKVVSATGLSPATLMVPAGVFDAGAVPFATPLATPPYVQFSSSLGLYAPVSAATFKAGPKGSRPVNFAFCPGATANPGCTSPATGGSQGTKNGLIVYTAGTAQFGGTMKVLFPGTWGYHAVVQQSPSVLIAQYPLAGGSPITGQGYAAKVSGVVGASAKVRANVVFSIGGLITGPGTTVTTIPGSTYTTTGMPLTTGHVYVKVPFLTATPFFTLSATGSDSRTPEGAGNITLVAGGVSNSVGAGASTPDILTVKFILQDVQEAPSLGRMGLVAAMGTMCALVWVRRRRQQAISA